MTYITPRTKALRHVDRLAQWRAGERPGPVTVEWDLSNVCSLACQSCHFAHTHVAGPWAARETAKPTGYSETGRFADVAMVERAITEMAAAGVRAIVWSGGGEPTLHPEFARIAAYAASRGLEQGLYTLGGHLDEDLVDTLRQTLSWLVVSLDAPDSATYAAEKGVGRERFNAACAGIRSMRQERIDVTCFGEEPQFLTSGPTLGVSFLLHAGNWMRADEMLEVARSLGATYATFRPTIETSPAEPGAVTGDRGWVTDALPVLIALSKHADVEIDVARFLAYRDWQSHGYSACHGVALVTSVTPDGRVWVCPNRRGVSGSELGDLRRESFADIWARHPGSWSVDRECRAMCRLHLVNQSIAPAFAETPHEAFV